jgi:hypothetical protein
MVLGVGYLFQDNVYVPLLPFFIFNKIKKSFGDKSEQKCFSFRNSITGFAKFGPILNVYKEFTFLYGENEISYL